VVSLEHDKDFKIKLLVATSIMNIRIKKKLYLASQPLFPVEAGFLFPLKA
jgi:hypothetical protein